jgi:predicted dehydrogenase
MRFLIAGFGSIGRRHFRNLVSLGEKDIQFFRTQKSNLPDEEIAGFPVHSNVEDALAQKPDAVIVSNPSSLHLDIAIPAVEQGCHILMEKPLSDSMERVPELTKVVEESGSRVLMGFQFRFHPGLNEAHEIISAGRIGRILSAHAHWGEYLPDWHPWEDYRTSYSALPDLGGGVILTLCHPLDYLRWLIGDVSELWAFLDTLGDLDLSVEDTAEIGLRFSGGAVGSLHLSYNQRPTVHTLEIIGTQGTIQWDAAAGTLSWYLSDLDEWQRIRNPDGFERNDMFRAEMRHFLAVVKGEEAPLCTLEDGVKALKLAVAAKRSAEFKQLVNLQ